MSDCFYTERRGSLVHFSVAHVIQSVCYSPVPFHLRFSSPALCISFTICCIPAVVERAEQIVRRNIFCAQILTPRTGSHFSTPLLQRYLSLFLSLHLRSLSLLFVRFHRFSLGAPLFVALNVSSSVFWLFLYLDCIFHCVLQWNMSPMSCPWGTRFLSKRYLPLLPLPPGTHIPTHTPLLFPVSLALAYANPLPLTVCVSLSLFGSTSSSIPLSPFFSAPAFPLPSLLSSMVLQVSLDEGKLSLSMKYVDQGSPRLSLL